MPSAAVNAQSALRQLRPPSLEVASRASVKPDRPRPALREPHVQVAAGREHPPGFAVPLRPAAAPALGVAFPDLAAGEIGGVPVIRLTPIARLATSVRTNPQPSP